MIIISIKKLQWLNTVIWFNLTYKWWQFVRTVKLTSYQGKMAHKSISSVLAMILWNTHIKVLLLLVNCIMCYLYCNFHFFTPFHLGLQCVMQQSDLRQKRFVAGSLNYLKQTGKLLAWSARRRAKNLSTVDLWLVEVYTGCARILPSVAVNKIMPLAAL